MSALLTGGRAGGHKVMATDRRIWVAMLEGTPRVLVGEQADGLIHRVRPGQWSLYEMQGKGVYQWIRDQQWPVGELGMVTVPSVQADS